MLQLCCLLCKNKTKNVQIIRFLVQLRVLQFYRKLPIINIFLPVVYVFKIIY